MKVVISTVVILAVFSCQGVAGNDAERNRNLKLVQVVFRHGDRNPIDPYPTYEHKDESYWPEGYAQLTKRGKMQHYELGQYFRERYTGFLNQSYSVYDTYVRSSNADRTIMSAEANLAGLYPPTDNISLWNPKIDWQPIPVHAQPEKGDYLIRMNGDCPKFRAAEDDFLNNSDVIHNLKRQYADIFSLVQNKSGKQMINPDDIEYVYDALYIQNIYYNMWPEWVTPEVLAALRNITAFSFKALAYTPVMQRLKGGPLLKEVVRNMDLRVNVNLTDDFTGSRHRSQKFLVYSGHDTTLAVLLNTMGVFEAQSPPYASAVMIELHAATEGNLNDTHYVQIWWKNTTGDPFLLTVPGCESSCPLKKFETLMRPNIPENWERECGHSSEIEQLLKLSLAGLLFLSVLALIIFGLVMCLRLCKRATKSPPAYPYLHLQMEDEDA